MVQNPAPDHQLRPINGLALRNIGSFTEFVDRNNEASTRGWRRHRFVMSVILLGGRLWRRDGNPDSGRGMNRGHAEERMSAPPLGTTSPNRDLPGRATLSGWRSGAWVVVSGGVAPGYVISALSGRIVAYRAEKQQAHWPCVLSGAKTAASGAQMSKFQAPSLRLNGR